MDQQQVIFEYGKLQLNFVSVSQQLMQVSTALAAANKEIAALKLQIPKDMEQKGNGPTELTGQQEQKPHIVPDKSESAGA